MYSISLFFFIRCEAWTLRWIRDFCILSVYPSALRAGNCIPLCLPTLSVTSISKTRSRPRIHRQMGDKMVYTSSGTLLTFRLKNIWEILQHWKIISLLSKVKRFKNKRMNAMGSYYIFFLDRVRRGCPEIHNIELVSDSLRSTCLCFLSLGIRLWTLIWGISQR